jgi:hypothetical protein
MDIRIYQPGMVLFPTAAPHGVRYQTLEAVLYRCGDWKASIESLEKAHALCYGGSPAAGFFLAMAHARLGHADQALQQFRQTEEDLAKHNLFANPELPRFRNEAAALLNLEDRKSQ